MARVGKLLNYHELLEKYPDWRLIELDLVYQEATEKDTEDARLRKRRVVGSAIDFFQKHGLTERLLCGSAPDLPSGFILYLRDVTPEGLEFYRSGYIKWLRRFERSMHADPTDWKILERELAILRGARRE